MHQPQSITAMGILLLAISLGIADPGRAQSPAARAVPASAISPLEIPLPPMKTLGGQVFWADQVVYFGWRIQRNTFTGHCRLLDDENCRHAFGDLVTCQATLNQIKRERGLPPMKGKAVLLLHGLGSMRLVAGGMADYLQTSGGYVTLCISYPSQFEHVGRHAASLASVIENLHGVEEINFVAHSMGNLVIRHYLADAERAGKSDPRIHRIVMIAPPNNGSELLATYGNNPLIALTHGASGQQLGKLWPKLAPRLATPDCEFGIIAGGRGTSSGIAPLLRGDNDGLVSVASTRLAGASDFIVVPAGHIAQLYSADIQQYTLSFLKQGYFVSEEERQPIE